MSTLKLPISGFVLEQAHANIDTLWGPYDTLALALEAIPVSKRKAGFKFGVTSGNTIIEYTFETDGATTATECVSKKSDYYSKNDIDGKVGNMQNLSTTEKNSLVGAINELKQGLDDKASTSALTDGLEGKQGTISDLDAIRSGAGKGATSVQGVKMEGDDNPLTPDGNGVVTIPQPEIPDSVTSVIANHELVFQTPDGQSVKGKVGITTGADGLLHLTLTDEEGHTYSSPIAGLRVVGNALQYSNDGEHWTTVQTFGKLAIKYAQASDPTSGDEGDLALVGTTNAYVLKVYVGESWVSVCDFGTLDLTTDGIKIAGENKTLTEELFDTKSVVLSNEVAFFKYGYNLMPDGNLNPSSNFMVSRLIDVRNIVSLSTTELKSGTSYKSGIYYDASGVAIESPVISNNGSLTIEKDDIPNGAAFVRFNYDVTKSPVVTLVEQKDWRHADVKSEGLDNVVFNKNTSTISSEQDFFVEGKLIGNDGNLSDSGSYKVSRLIDIRHTTELSTTDLKSGNSFKGVALYGADGAPISQNPVLNLSGTQTFIASDFPSDAVYIRFNYLVSSEPTVKQTTSEDWRDVRKEVYLLKKEVNDLTNEIAEEKTFVLSGESDFFVEGKLIGNDGNLSDSGSYKVSRLIDIKIAESISSTNVVSGTSFKGAAFYDANKLPIDVKGESGSVTYGKSSFPIGAVYIRFSYQASATPTVNMTYIANVASVEYKVEQIEKDYVKHEDLAESQFVEITQSMPPVSGFGVDSSGTFTNSGISSLPFYIADAKKINVTEIASISAQVKANMSFFDSDMQYLDKIDVPSKVGARSAEIQSSDFPSGACFVVVRFAYDTGTLKKTCSINDLDHELTNAYHKMTFTTSENGYINNNDGTFIKSNTEKCVRDVFIDGELLINPKIRIPSGTSNVASMCYYDKNGSYLNAVQSVDFSIPNNAAYVSMTWTGTGFGEGVDIYFVKYKRNTSKPILTVSALKEQVRTLQERLYTGLEFAGKAVFLGDSITEGYGASGFKLYHEIFSDFSGMERISLGIHLNTYGKRSDADIGQIYEQVANQNFPNDAKLVSIFAGTNDFGHNVEIGELFSVDETTGMKSAPPTTLTVAGGLHKTIIDVQAKVPLAKIVIITPLPRYYTSNISSSSRAKNTLNLYLKDYADAIKEIAAFYGIPVLDLFTMSNIDPHNETIAQTYYSDGCLHPNGLGHRMVGHLLFKFVRDNLVFD